jgi:hypothetical protein
VSEPAPYVVETAEAFAPDTVFLDGREQVVLAVRITPVYGQIDLTLLAQVVDAGNERGFALAREQPFRDEWLICIFDTFEPE